MPSKNDASDYSWVTDEMFDETLERIVEDMSPAEIFAIPGVCTILREELNNAVLERLESLRE